MLLAQAWAGSASTDLSTHNMLQPLPARPILALVYVQLARIIFSATIGTELYCNIYAQQLTNNQAFTGIGLFTKSARREPERKLGRDQLQARCEPA